MMDPIVAKSVRLLVGPIDQPPFLSPGIKLGMGGVTVG
jgi:hypothetical protein